MGVFNVIAYCVCTALRLLVGFMGTAIFIRALLSWFLIDEDSFLPRLLFALTEPVILPVRLLLSRFGMGEDSPVDFSPMITMILLMLIEVFLPVITL